MFKNIEQVNNMKASSMPIMGLIYTIQYLKYTADQIIVKIVTFYKCEVIILTTL